MGVHASLLNGGSKVMPIRLLRPGITDSEHYNALDWRAQSFYIRLLTLVDDYGRYDARPSVILGHGFAVWNDMNPDAALTVDEIKKMLQQCANAELLQLYEVQGKNYLQLNHWRERARSTSKYPEPPCQQTASNVPADCQHSVSKCVPPTPSPSSPPSPKMPSPPPNGRVIPKTLEEVKAWAQLIGCPEPEAERFWNHYEAIGWVDKNGLPIVNARNKLCNWKTDAQAWKHEKRVREPSSSSGFWEASKRLELVEKEINAIKERATHTALDVIIQDSDRAQYAELKAERKRLKALIMGKQP